jgi:hypothetical protein
MLRERRPEKSLFDKLETRAQIQDRNLPSTHQEIGQASHKKRTPSEDQGTAIHQFLAV